MHVWDNIWLDDGSVHGVKCTLGQLHDLRWRGFDMPQPSCQSNQCQHSLQVGVKGK